MKQYFNDKGEFHREDGPAIEWADSVKHWFIEGKRHQLDGPAVEWYDGKKNGTLLVTSILNKIFQKPL